MALRKICSYGSCHKVIDADRKYCDKHQEQFECRERERYKDYKHRRQQFKDKKKQQDFYNSKDWHRIRAQVVAVSYGMDIYEYYTTGRIISGDRVHHIVEINEDWESRLDILNLIPLTEKNHRHIHEEYIKSEKSKRLMQARLFDYLDMFSNEFG